MRRLRAGGARLSLLGVVALAAACGSSAKHGASSTAATALSIQPHRSSAVTDPAAAGSVARPGHPDASGQFRDHRGHAPRPRPQHARTGAVVPPASSSARRASALARVEQICRSSSRAQKPSLACQLLEASRHNKAVAGLLGAGAPSH